MNWIGTISCLEVDQELLLFPALYSGWQNSFSDTPSTMKILKGTP